MCVDVFAAAVQSLSQVQLFETPWTVACQDAVLDVDALALLFGISSVEQKENWNLVHQHFKTFL